MKRFSIKKVLAVLLAVSMVMTSLVLPNGTAYAATKAVKSVSVKIGTKNIKKKTYKITVGKTKKLKVTVKPASSKKAVTYQSSNKKIVTVSKKGKLTAKKTGTAKVVVKVKGKNGVSKKTWTKIKVVKKKKTKTPTPEPSPLETPMSTASATPMSTASATPVSTTSATPKASATPVSGKPTPVVLATPAPGTSTPLVSATPIPPVWHPGNTASPTPKASATPTVSPTPKASATPTASPTPTAPATPTASPTPTAPAEPTMYKITFNTDGGTAIMPHSVESGKMLTQPDNPTKKGCIFDGWYSDSGYKTEYEFNAVITKDMTLYAKWEKADITLTANKGEVLKDSKDSDQEVCFYAKPDKSISENLRLYDKDTGKDVGKMLDNGNTENGDDLPNDNSYAIKISMSDRQAGEYHFYVKSENSEQISNEVVIKVYAPLNEQQIQQMNNADTEIKNLMPEIKSLPDEKQAEAVEELLDQLQDDGLIQQDSVYYDGTNYSFVYDCGVYGMVVLEEFNNDEEEAMDIAGRVSTRKTAAEDGAIVERPTAPPKPPHDDIKLYGQKPIKIAILNSRANPNDPSEKGIYQRWNTLSDKLKEQNIDVTFDSNMTVEKYKTAFSGQDLVLVHSHGSRVNIQSKTYSLVCLRENRTKELDKKYTPDLQMHRIVRVTLLDGSQPYWVCPSFFSYYYNENNGNNQINNAIVYMGMCLGFGEGNDVNTTIDNTLGEELKRAGAATVLGYYNSVYTYYNLAMAESIVDNLLKGENIASALEKAKQTHGVNDNEWGKKQGFASKNPAALPILYGDNNTVLLSSKIINGSFEDSDEIGNSNWKYDGDARILEQLAELKPTQDSKMAIITTGIGSKEALYKQGTEGSYIYQYFKVPSGAKSINFSYDVVSEEPMEYVNSVFDDRFVAELVDEEGKVLETLAEETVNKSQWFKIENIDFEGGDHTTFHTKWKDKVCEEIKKYVGQTIAIRFSVCDLGDSIYDTAVLIDNVHFGY